jgi:hypothetical protein
MSILSIAETMEDLRKNYRRHPRLRSEWRVMVGKDDHGLSDLYFFAPKIGLWQIKGDLRTPYELVGKGAKIPIKKIDDEIMRRMMAGIPVPFGLLSPHPKYKDRAIVASGISSYLEETLPVKEHLPKARKVDENLRVEVEKLIRRLELDKPYL